MNTLAHHLKAPWALGLVVAAAVVGCKSDDSSDDGTVIGKRSFKSELCGQTLIAQKELVADFEVDCTGMDFTPGVGYGGTVLPIVSADSNVDGLAQCAFIINEPLLPPRINVRYDTNTASQTNATGLGIHYQGKRWNAASGCMVLDSYVERGRGQGSYDIIVEEMYDDAIQGTGRFARAHGPVDWCAYGYRDDCADLPEMSAFTKQVHLESVCDGEGVCATKGDGLASDCRVLLDPVTSGVQVDLEIGVWNGVPVNRIGINCATRRTAMANHFTFRAGAVTGPGSFGPWQSDLFGNTGEYRMPSFVLVVPRTWETDNLSLSCVMGYDREQSVAGAVDETVCSFTITDNPGHFSLDCTGASWSAPRTGGKSGSFSLEADCDVRTR